MSGQEPWRADSDAGITHSSYSHHYDERYFRWQESIGIFSAQVDAWKFKPFITKDSAVLDFGCGGGYLLETLECRVRCGVEVNPAARAAAARGLLVYSSVEEVPPDLAIDVVISHHALEHVDHPLHQLQLLYARLQPGGRAVFVVPSEHWLWQSRYRPGDINQHLYTWTPLSLGNLFARAGFEVIEAELLRHRWPPKPQALRRFLSQPVFHALCWVWGTATGMRQIRIVGRKPCSS